MYPQHIQTAVKWERVENHSYFNDLDVKLKDPNLLDIEGEDATGCQEARCLTKCSDNLEYFTACVTNVKVDLELRNLNRYRLFIAVNEDLMED